MSNGKQLETGYQLMASDGNRLFKVQKQSMISSFLFDFDEDSWILVRKVRGAMVEEVNYSGILSLFGLPMQFIQTLGSAVCEESALNWRSCLLLMSILLGFTGCTVLLPR